MIVKMEHIMGYAAIMPASLAPESWVARMTAPTTSAAAAQFSVVMSHDRRVPGRIGSCGMSRGPVATATTPATTATVGGTTVTMRGSYEVGRHPGDQAQDKTATPQNAGKSDCERDLGWYEAGSTEGHLSTHRRAAVHGDGGRGNGERHRQRSGPPGR